MEIKITEKKDNPLLSRKELCGTMIFNGPVPSKEELQKKLAKSENVVLKNIYIDRTESKFGFQEGSFRVYIYDNEKILAKCHKKGKKLLEKEKKAAEKKEAPKEEAKPVEKKEAPKEEAKPAGKKEAPKEEAKPAGKKEAPKEEAKPAGKKEEKKKGNK